MEGWFEFNDASVTPIQPGILQSKFGGNNHDGSAYMLVYRRKQMGLACQQPKLPEYQKGIIES